jgi:hypothetical protein
MLARAGFHIDEAQYGDSFDAAYLCRIPTDLSSPW